MSWNKNVPAITLDQVDALTLDDNEAYGQLSAEVQGQFDKAKAAVKQLIQSGVVGNPSSKKFNVGLSGHANPDHEVTVGYANDCISISISQCTN